MTEREYLELSVEELERRLRETFFYTDRIDETVYRELERLRAALEEKQPVEFPLTARESWEAFARKYAGELDRCCAGEARKKAAAKAGRYRSVLRAAIVAAAVFLLLAGAVLAAGPQRWGWVPAWNTVLGRYAPAAEAADGKPIPAALARLGIAEPVYPARLPEGFVLMESHISEDPLVLMEQYAKGDQLFSLTVTPIKGFKSAVYPAEGVAPREYGTDQAVHYLFKNEETIIAVRYTDHYATTVSGNISLEEIEWIMDSFGAPWEGGSLS